MTQASLEGARWIRARATQDVMAALQGDDAQDRARFVGGCVRNALMDRPVDDIDIATTLDPEDVMARTKAAGLKPVPTGIAHGTVTVVANSKPFEVTTLRRDVDTDGRHATVAFTDDWAEDARRRDFTMNALYCSADGRVHDPLGGLADLEARRVRFIGDAVTRIREDFLRILRFFRFHAWYGEGDFDAAALEAIIAERAGLSSLSAERVNRELLKLLQADDPGPALHAMAETGVLALILPEADDLARIDRLVALERELWLPADGVRRLAGLLGPRHRLPNGFAARLKLSNAVRDRLSALVSAGWSDIHAARGKTLRALSYRHGIDQVADLSLLAAAEAGGSADDVADQLDTLRKWQPPAFPLTGADVIAAGIPKGPKVGKVLKSLETWWMDEDFRPTREGLLARLKETVGGT